MVQDRSNVYARWGFLGEEMFYALIRNFVPDDHPMRSVPLEAWLFNRLLAEDHLNRGLEEG